MAMRLILATGIVLILLALALPSPAGAQESTPTPSVVTGCEDYPIDGRGAVFIHSSDYLSAIGGSLVVELPGVTIPAWPQQLAWMPRSSDVYQVVGDGVLRICMEQVAVTATATVVAVTATPSPTPVPNPNVDGEQRQNWMLYLLLVIAGVLVLSYLRVRV